MDFIILSCQNYSTSYNWSCNVHELILQTLQHLSASVRCTCHELPPPPLPQIIALTPSHLRAATSAKKQLLRYSSTSLPWWLPQACVSIATALSSVSCGLWNPLIASTSISACSLIACMTVLRTRSSNAGWCWAARLLCCLVVNVGDAFYASGSKETLQRLFSKIPLSPGESVSPVQVLLSHLVC